MPHGVYVKLDKCNREFLPARKCQKHAISGFCKECSTCRSFEGWVLVQPLCRQWSFTDPLTGFSFEVQRTQLPLMPEAACPLYALQGATCDPGLIAHFVMPKRADDDIKWLIVYVMLSRVRSLSRLRSIGLSPKIRKIIEGARQVCWPRTSRSSFARRSMTRAKQLRQPGQRSVGSNGAGTM